LYDDANPEGRETALAVLWSVLDRTVRLLHPYMPFLTEEIWQHLRRSGSPAARALSGWTESLPESVMVAPWPRPGQIDEEAEREIALVIDLVREARAVRSEYKLDPGKYISATVGAGPQLGAIQRGAETIRRLARLQPLGIHDVVPIKPARAVALLVGDVSVFLPLDELTDVGAERERLQKVLNGARQQLDSLAGRLRNESFTSRAPDAVVARERGKVRAREERVRRLAPLPPGAQAAYTRLRQQKGGQAVATLERPNGVFVKGKSTLRDVQADICGENSRWEVGRASSRGSSINTGRDHSSFAKIDAYHRRHW